MFISAVHDTWGVVSFNFFLVIKGIFKQIKPTTFLGLP